LAYLGLIPTALSYIPWYDLIGHFVLMGILAYLLHRATGRKSFQLLGINLPIGPSTIAVFAIIEELLQSLSSARNFSLLDLFFSLAGIVVFYLLDKLLESKSRFRRFRDS